MMGLVAVTAAQSSCMYCRRLDKNSGALVNWSFCNQTNECVENVWNYVTRYCREGWKSAKKLSLDDCQSVYVECPSFTSSKDKF